MLVCWSIGGGVGTSVVAAGLALAAARQGEGALLVDLGGDQPVLFGVPDPPGPGLAEWLRAAPDVPADALARLEVDLAPGIALVPRGSGELSPERVGPLIAALEGEARCTVVDAGCAHRGAPAAVVAGSDQTLLVTRACPVALRRMEQLPVTPGGVVVVRERRRTVTWHDVAAASGAPVLAELEVDPAVAAAVDGGLARRPLPRTFLRVLDGIR